MDYRKEHSVTEELDAVHKKMMRRYNLKTKAKADIAKAKRMEMYLRAFKAAGNQHDDKITPAIQSELEAQALQQIAQNVGQALGINAYSLFRNQHSWYHGKSQARWGADDVFEAELATLLDLALEHASGGNISAKDAGTSLVGNIAGNIAANFLKEVQSQGQKLANAGVINSNLIEAPTFRAGKVDLVGYTGNFEIESNILPQWQEFISLFMGAKCTLKNYSSNSNVEAIHLGKTNPMKAIIGQLDELQYRPKEAVHIYYHSLNSYNQDPIPVGDHLLHLRFAYELSGGGLYDSSGNRLDAADFFIYNDPSSNNIWVRSTKEMIANAMDYIDKVVRNPLTSSVIILKQSFN